MHVCICVYVYIRISTYRALQVLNLRTPLFEMRPDNGGLEKRLGVLSLSRAP